jgi:Tfp pilus assembly protein PilN
MNKAKEEEAPMKRFAVLAVLITFFFICVHVQPVFAQSNDEINTLKKEIDVLKENQKAIQKDIQEIKGQLHARQAPPEFKEAVIELGNNPFKGDKSAKVTLIEFSDYQ